MSETGRNERVYGQVNDFAITFYLYTINMAPLSLAYIAIANVIHLLTSVLKLRYKKSYGSQGFWWKAIFISIISMFVILKSMIIGESVDMPKHKYFELAGSTNNALMPHDYATAQTLAGALADGNSDQQQSSDTSTQLPFARFGIRVGVESARVYY